MVTRDKTKAKDDAKETASALDKVQQKQHAETALDDEAQLMSALESALQEEAAISTATESAEAKPKRKRRTKAQIEADKAAAAAAAAAAVLDSAAGGEDVASAASESSEAKPKRKRRTKAQIEADRAAAAAAAVAAAAAAGDKVSGVDADKKAGDAEGVAVAAADKVGVESVQSAGAGAAASAGSTGAATAGGLSVDDAAWRSYFKRSVPLVWDVSNFNCVSKGYDPETFQVLVSRHVPDVWFELEKKFMERMREKAAARAHVNSSERPMEADDIRAVSPLAQEVIGASLMSSVDIDSNHLPFNNPPRSGLGGDNHMRLQNGHTVHLRQFMPELALLPPHVEEKIERDYNAGFTHYANELLLTQALEDMGGRPFAPLSEDYLLYLIKEIAPAISSDYILHVRSYFESAFGEKAFESKATKCINAMREHLPVFFDSLDERTGHNSNYALLLLNIDALKAEGIPAELVENARSLQNSLREFLCLYEWLLAVVVADFKKRVAPRALDELIYYYYLLAQTTSTAKYFLVCDSLVYIQNSIALFELMRYGFTDSLQLKCFGEDKAAVESMRSTIDSILHAISDDGVQSSMWGDVAERCKIDPAALAHSDLGFDPTLSGTFELSDFAAIDESDKIALTDYSLDGKCGPFAADKDHASLASRKDAGRYDPDGSGSSSPASVAEILESVRNTYRHLLRDFLARNPDVDVNKLMAVGTEGPQSIGIEPDPESKATLLTPVCYTTLEEMIKAKPSLDHFCYLGTARRACPETWASVCYLLLKLQKQMGHDANVKLYGERSSAEGSGFFMSQLMAFLLGQEVRKWGQMAIAMGTEKLENPETLGMFLLDLFSNNQKLDDNQSAELNYVLQHCSMEEVSEAIKSGKASDKLKECALHLYHHFYIIQQLKPLLLPWVIGENASIDFISGEVHQSLVNLLCFYSKHYINKVDRTVKRKGESIQKTAERILHLNTFLENELLREHATSARQAAACFGIGDNGKLSRSYEARVSRIAQAWADRAARLDAEREEQKKPLLMGDTGFTALIPGMSAHTAYLIGRAYTYGELLPLNRYWGYSALVYAMGCGNYRAPVDLALYYYPMLGETVNLKCDLTLTLHLQACFAVSLGKLPLDAASGKLDLIHSYETKLENADYNTAFKLWQKNKFLQPILDRNPNLLRRTREEEITCPEPHPDMAAAIVSNTAILLCDIITRYPSEKEALQRQLSGVMNLVDDALLHTFSPDACFALFTYITQALNDEELRRRDSESRFFQVNYLVRLLSLQLTWGADESLRISMWNAISIDDKFDLLHLAMMFLQLGMISPEYREQGYNLLCRTLTTHWGNLAPAMTPYMDEFYRAAAALQNGNVLSYLSAMKKSQHNSLDAKGSAAAAAVETDVTGYAAGVRPRGAAVEASAEAAASTGAVQGADSPFDNTVAKVAALSPQDVAEDCAELSTLYAMLGVRFNSDACYLPVLHYYQLKGLDLPRQGVANEMLSLRRPMGYYELYLTLRDKEDMRQEAHTFLFYAARMNITEAMDELEALESSKSFKPLAFVMYWLYLEELAKTNVQALLCLMFLSATGLIVPHNALKMASLVERHHKFFTSSTLYSSLVKDGKLWDGHNSKIPARSFFSLFPYEADNQSFINNEYFGNASALVAALEKSEFIDHRYIEHEITDPTVRNVVCRMITRLSQSGTLLERYIIANLSMAETPLPKWMVPVVDKAAAVGNNFLHPTDPAGIDINACDFLQYPDRLGMLLSRERSLSNVFPEDVTVILKSQDYQGIRMYLNKGSVPLSLPIMQMYCMFALRDEHRPHPVIFSHMCRFLANLGYVLPRFYTHSNVRMFEQHPYGEIFTRCIVEPYHRDLVQSANYMSVASAKGELLQGLVGLLDDFNELKGETAVAPYAAKGSAFALYEEYAKAKGKRQGAASTADAAAASAAIEHAAARGAGSAMALDEAGAKAKGRHVAAGAGAADDASAVAAVEASEGALESVGVDGEAKVLPGYEATHFDLANYVQEAKDFVDDYQNRATNGVNNLLSSEFEDFFFLYSLYGAGLSCYRSYEERISDKDLLRIGFPERVYYTSRGSGAALVNCNLIDHLDLKRLQLLENADLGEAIKSFGAALATKAKKDGLEAPFWDKVSSFYWLRLALPPERCGRLGEVYDSHLDAYELRMVAHYLQAYVRYEYYLHSHGFEMREIILAARNGWTLGKNQRLGHPQRSYASLLAADALNGTVESWERYRYYIQSHIFKYNLNPDYFAEDESFNTALKFVQDVLQLDINSDKFREFVHNMQSEGFDEFKELSFACDNGYIHGRHHLRLSDVPYDPELGFFDAFKYYGGHGKLYSNFDCHASEMDIAVTRRVREGLKQLANAIDSLQTLSPQAREHYFTVSDDTLYETQTDEVLASIMQRFHQQEMLPDMDARWNPVVLRVNIERILGADNIANLVNMGKPEEWWHYTFSSTGTFELQDHLTLLPYIATMLPTALFASWDSRDQVAALSYMQSLREGKKEQTALKNAIAAYKAGATPSVLQQQVRNLLVSEQLYSTEFWGISCDQRMSRWHQGKEELQLALGRVGSHFHQEFARLRVQSSGYSNALYESNSFIWYLHRGLKKAGGEFSTSGHSPVAVADLDAVPQVDMALDLEGVSYDAKAAELAPSAWQEQEEQYMWSALQNKESYSGELFASADYSAQLLQNCKQECMQEGESFPSDTDYSKVEYSVEGKDGRSISVVKTPVLAVSTAIAAHNKAQADAALGKNALDHSVQAICAALRHLGLDPSKISQSTLEPFLSRELRDAGLDPEMVQEHGARSKLSNGDGDDEASSTHVDHEAALLIERLQSFLGDKLGLDLDKLGEDKGDELFNSMQEHADHAQGDGAVASSGSEKAQLESDVSEQEGKEGAESNTYTKGLSKIFALCSLDASKDWQYTRPFLFHEEENPLHDFIYLMHLLAKLSSSDPLKLESEFALLLEARGYFYGGVDLIDMSFNYLLCQSRMHRFFTSCLREQEKSVDRLRLLANPKSVPGLSDNAINICRNVVVKNDINDNSTGKWNDLSSELLLPKNVHRLLSYEVLRAKLEDYRLKTSTYNSAVLSLRKEDYTTTVVARDESLTSSLFADLFSRQNVLLHSPSYISRFLETSALAAAELTHFTIAKMCGIIDLAFETRKTVVLKSRQSAQLEKAKSDAIFDCKGVPFAEYKAALRLLGMSPQGDQIWDFDESERFQCVADRVNLPIEKNRTVFTALWESPSGERFVQVHNFNSWKHKRSVIRSATALLYGYYDDDRQLILHENLDLFVDQRKKIFPLDFGEESSVGTLSGVDSVSRYCSRKWWYLSLFYTAFGSKWCEYVRACMADLNKSEDCEFTKLFLDKMGLTAIFEKSRANIAKKRGSKGRGKKAQALTEVEQAIAEGSFEWHLLNSQEIAESYERDVDEFHELKYYWWFTMLRHHEFQLFEFDRKAASFKHQRCYDPNFIRLMRGHVDFFGRNTRLEELFTAGLHISCWPLKREAMYEHKLDCGVKVFEENYLTARGRELIKAAAVNSTYAMPASAYMRPAYAYRAKGLSTVVFDDLSVRPKEVRSEYDRIVQAAPLPPDRDRCIVGMHVGLNAFRKLMAGELWGNGLNRESTFVDYFAVKSKDMDDLVSKRVIMAPAVAVPLDEADWIRAFNNSDEEYREFYLYDDSVEAQHQLKQDGYFKFSLKEALRGNMFRPSYFSLNADRVYSLDFDHDESFEDVTLDDGTVVQTPDGKEQKVIHLNTRDLPLSLDDEADPDFINELFMSIFGDSGNDDDDDDVDYDDYDYKRSKPSVDMSKYRAARKAKNKRAAKSRKRNKRR